MCGSPQQSTSGRLSLHPAAYSTGTGRQPVRPPPHIAGITEWRANQPVVLNGSQFYLDVMFRKLKLVVEIDGRLYHTGAEVFETDRWRQNSLILDGWCVLRFTWTMIEEQPEKVIAMVREAIEMLAAKQS